MENLYEQTGKPLAPFDLDLEIPDVEDEADVSEVDESYEELPDMTVGSALDNPSRALVPVELHPPAPVAATTAPRPYASSKKKTPPSTSVIRPARSHSPRSSPSGKPAKRQLFSTSVSIPDLEDSLVVDHPDIHTPVAETPLFMRPPDSSTSTGNIPGYGKVQALAEYLVNLRSKAAITTFVRRVSDYGSAVLVNNTHNHSEASQNKAIQYFLGLLH